jgi:signal transduction histidine kinase
MWSVGASEREASKSEHVRYAPILHAPHVRIWIEDNGIGIPKHAQDKIFRMFQRMHRETEYPGTGIGLAIVRKAVERMNGRIFLDSELGKGTRVCVELPRPAESQGRAYLQDAA